MNASNHHTKNRTCEWEWLLPLVKFWAYLNIIKRKNMFLNSLKNAYMQERNCFYEGVPLYLLKELDRKSYLERERHA